MRRFARDARIDTLWDSGVGTGGAEGAAAPQGPVAVGSAAPGPGPVRYERKPSMSTECPNQIKS